MKNIATTYPLSPMQQGMLFHTFFAQHSSGTYIEQFCITLYSDLNTLAFKQAWQQIIDRHDVLRTSFHREGDREPIQKVHKQAQLTWLHLDWREKSAEQQHKDLDTFRQADFTQGFQLSQAPLMRCSLLQTADNVYQFVWSHHHILLDGCSLIIILKEVFALYEASCHKKAIYLKQTLPYHDYIAWLREKSIAKAETFWKERLKGFTSPTPIHINTPLNNSVTSLQNDYAEQQIQLSKATTDALNSLARHYQISLNSLIQGAWALLLSRYNDANDIIFGATVWQRPTELEKVESMVGLAINTLPVRIQFSENDWLIPSIQKWQAQLMELEQYAYTPLLDIQKWSELPSGIPLFNSIVFFDDYLINSDLTTQFSSLKIGPVYHRGRTDYPVTIIISPGTELLLRFMYDCNCFNASKINQIMRQLKTLLKGIATNPLQKLCELPLLTKTEKQQFKLWNNTATNYPDLCLHQLVEAQVERTPDNVAVVFKDQLLNYSTLNNKANQLAHYLTRLGINPDILVGLFIERCIEMPIGLLGILKAGGGYVPLDPTFPKARLASIIEDAELTVILTQSHLVRQLPQSGVQIVCLDTHYEQLSCLSMDNPVSGVEPYNLAYVIYTSGSTGKPKGVMIPHQAITNHTFWMQENFPLDNTDKVLQKTPFSFDASVWEFYAPLISGAQLIMAKPDSHQDPAYLVKTIIEQQITTIQLVPSLLRIILQQQGIRDCHSLRRIFCGGEALQVDVKEQCLAVLKSRLFNLYGPTEACIDTTFSRCQQDDNLSIVPIGRPIANTRVYILDKLQRFTPTGAIGELHIGGIGLARGYLKRPELTTDKFIKIELYNKTERIYKTGDLARWLPDGNIEYLGRKDHQVKLHGFRIELGEIESTLLQYHGIDKALVTIQKHANDKRLVAYLTHSNLQQPTPKELHFFLKQQLPDYMVPSTFVLLDKFPLTANGKIDRNALPLASEFRLETELLYAAPRSPLEEKLIKIWQNILQLDRVGIHDNFFGLGGHSILIMQLAVRINQQFQIEIPLHLLFEAPTVASFSVKLEKILNQNACHAMTPIKILPRKRSNTNRN